MTKKWNYASCKAKNKEDRFVKIIFIDKQGEKQIRFRRFNKSEFKEVNGKIYQIRKDKAGNELLSETYGFENVVWRPYKNKKGEDCIDVRMTTYSKEEVELYNQMAEAFGDYRADDTKKEDK